MEPEPQDYEKNETTLERKPVSRILFHAFRSASPFSETYHYVMYGVIYSIFLFIHHHKKLASFGALLSLYWVWWD